jgi:hypothetical protein
MIQPLPEGLLQGVDGLCISFLSLSLSLLPSFLPSFLLGPPMHGRKLSPLSYIPTPYLRFCNWKYSPVYTKVRGQAVLGASGGHTCLWFKGVRVQIQLDFWLAVSEASSLLWGCRESPNKWTLPTFPGKQHCVLLTLHNPFCRPRD